MKKTILSLLMAPVFAWGLGSCNKTYKIDRSQVVVYSVIKGKENIKEIKLSGEKILYFYDQVIIEDNALTRKYYPGSRVFEQAQQREKDILRKIDSINCAEQHKIDSFYDAQEQKDLEVLKKWCFKKTL